MYKLLTGSVKSSRPSSSTLPFQQPPLLNRHQLSHSLGFLRFTTTAYNSKFQSAILSRTRAWQIWFSLGAYFGLFALVASIVILVVAVQRFLENLSPDFPSLNNGNATALLDASLAQTVDFRSSSRIKYSTGTMMGTAQGKQFLVSMVRKESNSGLDMLANSSIQSRGDSLDSRCQCASLCHGVLFVHSFHFLCDPRSWPRPRSSMVILCIPIPFVW